MHSYIVYINIHTYIRLGRVAQEKRRECVSGQRICSIGKQVGNVYACMYVCMYAFM